jgi:hypothetical protein
LTVKSLAPIGWRTRLSPMPLVGWKSEFIREVRWVALSRFQTSQADESVNDAPKPSIVWKVLAGSTSTVVAEPVSGPNVTVGCWASSLL